ncbi:MAG: sigma-70 family RNA polymerase sigma factor [Novosphingobium sp.]|uniref:RNA polymerase sigma factor n=1 Tax=Novosphingobium sp. TaxID=1874826 RepID=UPI0012CCBCB1|nr:sigma-70 family RNA polymerase sigma factor [Novosphingobium sp.]MPS69253.1 sigma-70 family RNA polymerase sigma factor [Novosphingobium sp.]
MSTNAFVLSHLLLRERPSLLKRLRRMLRDERAAEDVTQGLWLKIQSVHDHPPIDNPGAYLHRLAMNAATDALRASKRRGALVEAEVADLLWVEDDSPAPDRIAIGRDMLERIMAALASLPEPTCSIFRLNRFEGLTQREIAARYGVSTTVVERHIRRALKALDNVRNAP